MRRPGQVFSKNMIMDRLWGYDASVNENNKFNFSLVIKDVCDQMKVIAKKRIKF